MGFAQLRLSGPHYVRTEGGARVWLEVCMDCGTVRLRQDDTSCLVCRLASVHDLECGPDLQADVAGDGPEG